MNVNRVASSTGNDSDAVLLNSNLDRTLNTVVINNNLHIYLPELESLVQVPASSWVRVSDSRSLTGDKLSTSTAGASITGEFWGTKLGLVFSKLGGEYELEIDGNPLTLTTFDFTSIVSRVYNSIELLNTQNLDRTIKHYFKLTAITPANSWLEGVVIGADSYPQVPNKEQAKSARPYFSDTVSVNGTDQLIDLLEIYSDIVIRSTQNVSIKWNNSANDSISLLANRKYSFSSQNADSIYVTTTGLTSLEVYANG